MRRSIAPTLKTSEFLAERHAVNNAYALGLPYQASNHRSWQDPHKSYNAAMPSGGSVGLIHP